jgi:hypothetical protein
VEDPFQVSMNFAFTGPHANLPITVPAGKRLMIESASVLTKLPAGQRAYVSLGANDATKGVGSLYFSLQHQGTFDDGRDVWTAAESTRVYTSGGAPSSAFFSIVRNSGTGECWIEVSLAGYLVSIPPP